MYIYEASGLAPMACSTLAELLHLTKQGGENESRLTQEYQSPTVLFQNSVIFKAYTLVK
jgi:hypothetical protein